MLSVENYTCVPSFDIIHLENWLFQGNSSFWIANLMILYRTTHDPCSRGPGLGSGLKWWQQSLYFKVGFLLHLHCIFVWMLSVRRAEGGLQPKSEYLKIQDIKANKWYSWNYLTGLHFWQNYREMFTSCLAQEIPDLINI